MDSGRNCAHWWPAGTPLTTRATDQKTPVALFSLSRLEKTTTTTTRLQPLKPSLGRCVAVVGRPHSSSVALWFGSQLRYQFSRATLVEGSPGCWKPPSQSLIAQTSRTPARRLFAYNHPTRPPLDPTSPRTAPLPNIFKTASNRLPISSHPSRFHRVPDIFAGGNFIQQFARIIGERSPSLASSRYPASTLGPPSTILPSPRTW